MHASNGILFNHESPIRGETFVTRKITRAVSKIALGLQDKLYLGNLSAQRDWGHAKDYIKAMYLVLQQDQPDDYVIATGITTTVRDFVCYAFQNVGLEITFNGEGVNEKGYLTAVDEALFKRKVGENYLELIKQRINANSGGLREKNATVAVDSRYFRPTEVELLIGDPTKAKTKLGWEPEYDLNGLLEDMMKSDVELMKRNSYLKDGGYRVMNYFE
jgi:GDPmannose 4,6-dehydratase